MIDQGLLLLDVEDGLRRRHVGVEPAMSIWQFYDCRKQRPPTCERITAARDVAAAELTPIPQALPRAGTSWQVPGRYR
jgi:hypothetical protein